MLSPERLGIVFAPAFRLCAIFRSMPSKSDLRRSLSRVHDIAFEDHQFPLEPGGPNIDLM